MKANRVVSRRFQSACLRACAIENLELRTLLSLLAVDDAYSMTEDTTLVADGLGGHPFTVLTNDFGLPTSAAIQSNPSHGTISFSSNGAFTYTPAGNYVGSDSFTYNITDGTQTSNTATVSININNAPDVPVAVNDSYTILEDGVLNANGNSGNPSGVIANDINIDGFPLTLSTITLPTHGTLNMLSTGEFIYQPHANFNGTDGFTYRLTDTYFQTSNIATVTFNVSPVNDTPIAQNDSYTVGVNNTLVANGVGGNAAGVLANDSDVEGSALTAVLSTGPAHGSLTLAGNGTFTYVPTANYTGSDSFTYRASDGLLSSALATVTIAVGNLPPVAVNDSYVVDEDVVLTANGVGINPPGVLANDFDPNGSPLTAAIVSGPSHGTLNFNVGGNGYFTYTPAADFNGTDSFVYRNGDGALLSNNATVTIQVAPINDAPIASNDAYSIAEDNVLTVSGVASGTLGNDIDPEGSAMSASVLTLPGHGTLTLNSNGTFTYTPAVNFNGSDSFTYRASDGTLLSLPATVTITVTPVSDPPVAVGDSYFTNEDVALLANGIGSNPVGVLSNDTDVDGDTLTAFLLTQPAHGTVSLLQNGNFTYTPTANYAGPDSFSYQCRDGSTNSSPATVSIFVFAVNDAPVANDDAYTIAEDTLLNVNGSPGRLSVLANDTDIDTSASNLRAIILTAPAHGTLSLGLNGLFTYTPADNYVGLDTFEYLANDSDLNSELATVRITITPVNDPPLAVNDSYTLSEDTTLTANGILGNPAGVLANDSDPDSAISASIRTQPSHGSITFNSNGTFSYTPAANYNGFDSFMYRLSDGQFFSADAMVTLNIAPVNDAPTATNDTYTIVEDNVLNANGNPAGVLVNDSDIDSPSLTAVLIGNPAHGQVTLNANGTFVYTPALNYNGTDSFTYRASDGSAMSAVATVGITITPVNDPPTATNDAYSISQGTILRANGINGNPPTVLANDFDPEGSFIQVTTRTNPLHGTVSLLSDGSFTYTPANGYFGTDSFTYRITDGSLTSTPATVTITIAQNLAPVAVNDSYTVAEDSTLNANGIGGNPAGVLANDSDPENAPLNAAIRSQPAHGTVTFNSDGTFLYTPAPNYFGQDSFTYRNGDGVFLSNDATVTIDVTSANDNDLPVAMNDAYAVEQDSTLQVGGAGVLANDNSPEARPLNASLLTQPLHGSITFNTDGTFVYIPTQGYVGPDSFTYRNSDGVNQSNVATVDISVTVIANHAPQAIDDVYTVGENQTLTADGTFGNPAGVLGNDLDAENDPLTAALVSSPNHGTVIFNSGGPGGFFYIPDIGFTGVDTFTYVAGDGLLLSNVATVTINVVHYNQPVGTPQFVLDAPRQCLQIAFDQNVGFSIDAMDLFLFNTTAGTAVDFSMIAASYDFNTNVATFTFPGFANGVLPDGMYQASMPAFSVFGPGGPMANDVTAQFTVLKGDANGDHTVNFEDLLVVAQNYGQTSRHWSSGDFTYDGLVDFSDLLILAQTYGSSLFTRARTPAWRSTSYERTFADDMVIR